MSLSLYIHYPFCRQKCLYCDFPSLADSSVTAETYVAALVREMELCRQHLPPLPAASTLFFGGGTPSLLPPALVETILDTAARLFGLEDGAEITLEANPGTVTPETLAGYRSAGVNRLSLGVQSFDDRLLARLGRIHTAAEARAAVAAARRAGFANLGLDLIHSLPDQTVADWQEDLAAAITLEPTHISAYALSVEEGTPFHDKDRRGELPLPGEEEAVAMLRITPETLASAGYEQYEISNFARPGYRSRHNQVYWRRTSYLGFGAAAHSFLDTPPWGVRWQNPADPETYLRFIATGKIREEKATVLSREDAMAEVMFLGLRLLEGVAEKDFAARFGCPVDEAYPGVVGRLGAEGLVERSGERIRLTRRGLLLGNRVFAAFA